MNGTTVTNTLQETRNNGNRLQEKNTNDKRPLENVNDNRRRSGSEKPLKKRKAVNSLVESAQDCPMIASTAVDFPRMDSSTNPTSPTSSSKRMNWMYNVTAFDIKRAEELSGLYMPVEYVECIVRGMDREGKSAKIRANYFDTIQTDIKPRMRTILFGWLTEVVLKFEMKEIVLWSTFNLVDRYLSMVNVRRDRLQLLGCAAMWVSSKFHEIYPPVSADFVHMSDGAFTKDELLRMEETLCEALSYKFTNKTPYQYLERFTNIAMHGISPEAHTLFDKHMATDPTSLQVGNIVKQSKRIKFLARYAMERWNLDNSSLGRPYKHMAAMALYTALSLTSNVWTKDLVKCTGFSEAALRTPDFPGGSFKQYKAVVLDFESEPHRAVIRKYKRADYGCVSTLRKKHRK